MDNVLFTQNKPSVSENFGSMYLLTVHGPRLILHFLYLLPGLFTGTFEPTQCTRVTLTKEQTGSRVEWNVTESFLL